jgi:hypothetical protein
VCEHAPENRIQAAIEVAPRRVVRKQRTTGQVPVNWRTTAGRLPYRLLKVETTSMRRIGTRDEAVVESTNPVTL